LRKFAEQNLRCGFLAIKNDSIGAKLPASLRFFNAACGRDDLGPDGLGHLQDHRPDSTGPASYENRLAGL
jgi:hypothetical protein